MCIKTGRKIWTEKQFDAREKIKPGLEFSTSPAALVTLKQRGVSLIELIIFILIISAALMGILSVMNVTTKYSSDPLIHKQAIAIAESLLEEIELQDFIDQNDGVSTTCPPASAVTPTTRSSIYHIIDCYRNYPNGGPTTGIYGMDGSPIPNLTNYSESVSIAPVALGNVLAGSSVLITVTVTDPQNNQISINGYRTKY